MFDPPPQLTDIYSLKNRLKTESSAPLYTAKFVSIERRSPSNTVFMVDEAPFQSAMPRANHWSIAWSDLMMTMFVLFLSMFVYQSANRDFLVHEEPEVVGGTTTDALDTDYGSDATFPFAPIKPGLPLITGGTIKKVETITLQDVDLGSASVDGHEKSTSEPLKLSPPPEPPPTVPEETRTAIIIETPGRKIPVPAPGQDIIEPRPLILEEPSPPPDNQIQEIYKLGQEALDQNNLEKFAALELVPDKTMRIVLTGDLLFDTGLAELSMDAVHSLKKITTVIKDTPYMINVVGHTDNVPMYSGRFASNWELSVARASTVARFLIQDMKMDPSQFVVSGYSSYRPLKPNTNAANRAENRRVEIIISKRLPQPIAANQDNLQ